MKNTLNKYCCNKPLLGAAMAFALSAGTSLSAADNTELTLNIPGQSAGTALMELAKRADVQIMIANDLGESVQLKPISGNYTLTAALDQMLSGTTLKYEFRDDESVVIKNAAEGEVDYKKSREGLKKTVMEEVLVTANKREQSMQDLPMSINAFGAERLAESGVNNIDDIQFLAAGLKIGEGIGQSLVTIRGIGNQQSVAGAESGGAVHLDGVYLSSRYDQARAYFDVDRIEVLRGPQGTLYGRNATGGAINIITREPTEEFEAGLEATFGNYNLIETEGYMSGPIVGDNVMGRIAFKQINRDGYTHNIYNGQDYDNAEAASMRGKLKITPTDTFTVDLGVDFNRDTGVRIAVTERFDPNVPTQSEVFGGFLPTALGADQRVVNHDAETFQEVETKGAFGKLTWDLDSVTLTSLTAYRDAYFRAAFDIDYTDADSLVFREWLVDTKHISQEVNLASNGSGPLQWILGGYYFREDTNTHIDIPLPLFGFDLFQGAPELETTAYALYGEASYPLGEKLKLTLGARYSKEKKSLHEISEIAAFGIFDEGRISDEWSSFTPKIALDYTLTDNSLLYTTVSRGFKAGGFNTFAIQGSAFDPELVTNYEMGMKSNLFDDRVRLNWSAFLMDYEDLQVFQVTSLPGDAGLSTNIVTNAGASTIKGVELEVEARANDSLSLDANVSYLDATYDDLALPSLFLAGQSEDVSGNQLTGAPKWAANLGVSYTMPVGAWGSARLRGEYSYQSKVYFRPHNEERVSQDAYGIANVRLTFEDNDGRWKYALFIKNLTDELIAAAQNLTTGDGFPIQNYFLPPRTYGLSVSVDY